MTLQRHPLHSICPYYGMFPENFVERHVLAHTRPGDIVFDPFAGRGTTVFQSLLIGRRGYGMDVNPVAACIAGAKADPAGLVDVLQRIAVLEAARPMEQRPEPPTPFFAECFHRNTLAQILYLRAALQWESDRVDRFIAAMTLGALHGESHRSELYLSNRMPRTISTKPEYSLQWWRKKDLKPPERDAFVVLRKLARFRLRVDPPAIRGEVARGDAREANEHFATLRSRVRMIVTSPPYLDVTDYAEDQWLRLWFLGGKPYPKKGTFEDDRHTDKEKYWNFLKDCWRGVSELMADSSTVVVRFGGELTKKEITAGLNESLSQGFGEWNVRLAREGVTTSQRRQQTRSFRPGARGGLEHDFVFRIS